ncbi:MAG: hypothetical protein Q7R67_02700 [bacterium]|nr:hypothetical protein [bacterium]
MTKTIVVLLIILGLGGAVFGYTQYKSSEEEGEQVYCTMEAKLCPDGSYVGRSGPKCEFAPCPTGDSGGDTGIVPFKSGVRGLIMVGPVCPVMQYPPVEDCNDRPLATKVTISRASNPSNVIIATVSGKDGKFTADLAPGNYVINAGESQLPRCSPTSITVLPNKYASITISCDSGIR